MKNNKWLLAIFTLSLLFLITACNSSSQGGEETATVILKVHQDWRDYKVEIFEDKPVESGRLDDHIPLFSEKIPVSEAEARAKSQKGIKWRIEGKWIFLRIEIRSGAYIFRMVKKRDDGPSPIRVELETGEYEFTVGPR